jgi:hypothetical protein
MIECSPTGAYLVTPTEQEAKLTELGTRFEILTGIVIGLVGAIISTRDTLHKLASQPTLLLSQSDRKDIAAEIAELGRRTEKAITDLDEVMKLGGRQ